MRIIAMISGCLVMAGTLLVLSGCSSRSSSEPAEPINGMSPAEYREKAELSREIPAAKPKKPGGRSR